MGDVDEIAQRIDSALEAPLGDRGPRGLAGGLFSRASRSRRPTRSRVMREAGLVVGRTLELLREAVAPGVTTAELDALAHDTIRAHGATSNFLGYGAHAPGQAAFPGSSARR